MGTQLDLIISFVIGGLLLLTILNTNANMMATATQNTLDVLTQENLSVLSEMILYDFHKMGYYPSFVAPDDFRILAMDSTSIRFRADIDNDGSIDTVYYGISDTSEAAGTSNPRDVILYRLLNGEAPLGAALGVTDFSLEYYDAVDSVTATAKDVRSIEIMLAVESPYAYDDYYPRAIWKTVVRPRNLDLN